MTGFDTKKKQYTLYMTFPLTRPNLPSIYGKERNSPLIKRILTTCKDWHFQGSNIMKRKENIARKEAVKQNPVPGVKIFGCWGL